ncbi:SUF system Fe-S cluster assembly regulator [Algiphilus sp.]|uniref:SUF system Fe-S cluster assembly regulator n=1 Tax=Algiphilus sp. TaxID=1872431 RepID=UPI0025BECB4A|nr:SUF system Fe-S cluster assembly regulator [Algiphilus sp.]MCK5770853.1 SUF system Fe-S cluster assembly regulator [Algiphilus sp.]
MRLGKLTDYATVVLTEMAQRPGERRSTAELAQHTHLSATTVAKLLRQLAQAGVVKATRGANGGYVLAHDAGRITIADVVAALEGPIALTSCTVHGEGCPIDDHCGVRTNWWRINAAIERALASVTLADMSAPLPAQEFPLRRVDAPHTRQTAGA